MLRRQKTRPADPTRPLSTPGIGWSGTPWVNDKPTKGSLQLQYIRITKTNLTYVECQASPRSEATILKIAKDLMTLTRPLTLLFFLPYYQLEVSQMLTASTPKSQGSRTLLSCLPQLLGTCPGCPGNASSSWHWQSQSQICFTRSFPYMANFVVIIIRIAVTDQIRLKLCKLNSWIPPIPNICFRVHLLFTLTLNKFLDRFFHFRWNTQSKKKNCQGIYAYTKTEITSYFSNFWKHCFLLLLARIWTGSLPKPNSIRIHPNLPLAAKQVQGCFGVFRSASSCSPAYSSLQDGWLFSSPLLQTLPANSKMHKNCHVFWYQRQAKKSPDSVTPNQRCSQSGNKTYMYAGYISKSKSNKKLHTSSYNETGRQCIVLSSQNYLPQKSSAKASQHPLGTRYKRTACRRQYPNLRNSQWLCWREIIDRTIGRSTERTLISAVITACWFFVSISLAEMWRVLKC